MAETAGQALVAGIARLREAGVPDPARDARRLMAHALDVPPARLTLALGDPISQPSAQSFADLVSARSTRQPVSQILGTRDFFGRVFEVTPDVLDPRPETETLVETALSLPGTRVLDLGTGSGAILLTVLAERAGTTGLGTDLSAAALTVARRTAERFDLVGRVGFAQGPWWEPVDGQFDLILSNPPYIAADEMPDLAPEVRDHEPHMALTDHADGLTAYRTIAGGVLAHLAPQGWIAVEIGPTQARSVSALFADAGLDRIAVRQDFDGRDRVVLAQRPPQ